MYDVGDRSIIEDRNNRRPEDVLGSRAGPFSPLLAVGVGVAAIGRSWFGSGGCCGSLGFHQGWADQVRGFVQSPRRVENSHRIASIQGLPR